MDCESYGYVLARVYAQEHNVSLKALIRCCEKGEQRNARKVGHHWVVERNAPCAVMPENVIEAIKGRMVHYSVATNLSFAMEEK